MKPWMEFKAAEEQAGDIRKQGHLWAEIQPVSKTSPSHRNEKKANCKATTDSQHHAVAGVSPYSLRMMAPRTQIS